MPPLFVLIIIAVAVLALLIVSKVLKTAAQIIMVASALFLVVLVLSRLTG